MRLEIERDLDEDHELSEVATTVAHWELRLGWLRFQRNGHWLGAPAVPGAGRRLGAAVVHARAALDGPQGLAEAAAAAREAAATRVAAAARAKAARKEVHERRREEVERRRAARQYEAGQKRGRDVFRRLLRRCEAAPRQKRPRQWKSSLAGEKRRAVNAGEEADGRGRHIFDRIMAVRLQRGRGLQVLVRWQGEHADSWQEYGSLSKEAKREARAWRRSTLPCGGKASVAPRPEGAREGPRVVQRHARLARGDDLVVADGEAEACYLRPQVGSAVLKRPGADLRDSDSRGRRCGPRVVSDDLEDMVLRGGLWRLTHAEVAAGGGRGDPRHAGDRSRSREPVGGGQQGCSCPVCGMRMVWRRVAAAGLMCDGGCGRRLVGGEAVLRCPVAAHDIDVCRACAGAPRERSSAVPAGASRAKATGGAQCRGGRRTQGAATGRPDTSTRGTATSGEGRQGRAPRAAGDDERKRLRELDETRREVRACRRAESRKRRLDEQGDAGGQRSGLRPRRGGSGVAERGEARTGGQSRTP